MTSSNGHWASDIASDTQKQLLDARSGNNTIIACDSVTYIIITKC